MQSFTEKINSIQILLKDIKEATNNFADENLIRQGGQRKIYKGELSRSEEESINIVAVCFDPKSWRGKKEFRKEITMLYSLKHPNLASIVGFCDEDNEMIIITKLEAKGSLDHHLSDPTLTWTQRLRICLGIAHALSYIHYAKKRKFCFIHSNIKSSKILLDDKWEAKLFGFELSKMQVVSRRQGLVLDRLVSGTGAYVDPAYLKTGGVTHKSDIYSLGVVLFEVLCGRKAFVKQEPKPPTAPSFDRTVRREYSYEYHENKPPAVSYMKSIGKPPSLDLEYEEAAAAVSYMSSVMQPPSFTNFGDSRNSWKANFLDFPPPSLSYSFSSYRPVEEVGDKEYMSTLRSLKYLNIPEDGLLAKSARSHYEKKTLDDIIHKDLQKDMDSRSLKKFSEAAYCCLKEQRAQRPNIDRVILALKQALGFQLEHDKSVSKEHSTVAVESGSTGHLEGKDFEHLKIGLEAIRIATDKFSEKNYIGRGGYGVVYKGELEHFDFSKQKASEGSEQPKKRSMVAIKHILINSDVKLGAEEGFFAEIETLSSCNHPNIVNLLGFCHEPPQMFLVYELLSNGSLDEYLGTEGKMTNFTWVERIKICIGIAKGLNYIHTTIGNNKKIIHRDIKSANILLDDKWEPKIADFGLSKIHSSDQMKSTLILSKVAGTEVYWDPEYSSTGHLKKESDVYSFGVVLFEIMTGKLAYDWVTDDNPRGLAPIVRQIFQSKKTLKEMLDPKLKEESDESGFTLSKGPNEDSLQVFSKIGYKCLSEKQKDRPTMEFVIQELENALKFQEAHKDSLGISFEDIQKATQNFNSENQIGVGGFGKVYLGKILRDNEPTLIVAKRNDSRSQQGEQEFLTELEILFEYKHENVISLLGYCDENDERISVFEYASHGSLDKYVGDPNLTWTKRLKIAIDVATGLDFLHGGGSTQAFVIHRDIKSSNILLAADWKAKISDFGLSMITAIDDEMDFVDVDDACGTPGYVDPVYLKDGTFTRESDIYSLGVVLFEIMCGRLAFSFRKSHGDDLVSLVKRYYVEGKLDELVFEDIKNDMIVPASLTAYNNIAYECLHKERERRPTASNLVLKLKEALEFQEDIEIWKAKLPEDYKEMIQISKTPETYSNLSNKKLCVMFSEGILLKKGKVCLSVNSNNGEQSEMVSATMFSYENKIFQKRISIPNSRFKRVVKIMDITHLKIQIDVKTEFLSTNVIYGAHLVFKFCDPRKLSSKSMYANLKYQMGSHETMHAYFATRRDDDWMTIELCRFIPYKKDIHFKVLLESLSRYYCGSGGIYVEGIHFRAMDDANVTLKVKPNSDSGQQVSVDYDEITRLEDDEKLYSLSKANEKKCHMLPAKMVLYETSNVKCFQWKSLAEPESRFLEVVELLSHQVLRIKCKIETQKLSPETEYACYLIFKLSKKCHGLQCPVRVRNLLLRKSKEFKFLYFRSPRVVNFHGSERIPKQREDGLMEVIVWEFNSGSKQSDDDNLHMSLKLRCYEGTMCGLIVYGIEFRPV